MERFSKIWNRAFGCITVLGLVCMIITLAMDRTAPLGPCVIVTLTSLALAFMGSRVLSPYAFTVWVFVGIVVALLYPGVLDTCFTGMTFEFKLTALIVPLIQVIMFGMGTTLSVSDFVRVMKMPWPVLIGMMLQFSVMPILGYTIARIFSFEPEIAAGVVLIGSCPGGVASNLMTYLARGNVALSVTMTSCSTLASPFMTPLMMKLFASQYINIPLLKMMLAICNMIIVPIVAGLIANRILYSDKETFRRPATLLVISLACLVIAGTAALVDSSILGVFSVLGSLQSGVVVGAAMVGVVAVTKLVVDVMLNGPEDWMDKVLPTISMAGICYIIAIITAQSSDDLLHVGGYLIAAAMIHNLVGYFIGYWAARAAGLAESDCRTVSIEVALQNGGMASGLAINTLASAKAALAPAIFGPWMNLSGSMLATWWRRRAEGVEDD